jgi:hypothetical protein
VRVKTPSSLPPKGEEGSADVFRFFLFFRKRLHMFSDPGQTRISAGSHQQETNISCNRHHISGELPYLFGHGRLVDEGFT